MRDSTIIYRSFYEAICGLPEVDQAITWRAIFDYALNFKESELAGLPKTIFLLIKPQLDANIKRYKNGTKPKDKQKESGKKAKAKQKASKSTANENENLNENENENPEQIFEAFRKLYPGSKKGGAVEFKNFQKHSDYETVVHLLEPALKKLTEWRTKASAMGKFVPEYAHLSTWINQRRWEVEHESLNGGVIQKADDYTELKKKGWSNCTPEELTFAYNHQHRTQTTYLEFPETELLVKPGISLTRAEANAMRK